MRQIALGSTLAALVVLTGMGMMPALAQEQQVFQPHCSTLQADAASGGPTALCEIGPVAGGRILKVAYQKDTATQPAADAAFQPFATSGKAAAVLVVVDRSDRKRTRTVSLGAGDAVRMIEAARGVAPNNRFGLAALSGDRLDVVAPIGANAADIAKAATSIRADGNSADGVRGVLEAIRQLAQAPADRHILVLASDGKAEDKSYARDDVIRAATDAGIAVVTLGYRERTGDGPELQSLKRLAEETGGYFAEPPLPSSRLDDAAVGRFAPYVVSGGTAAFALDKTEPRGRYLINAELDSGRILAGTYVAEIGAPVVNRSLQAPAQTAAPQPRAAAPIQVQQTLPAPTNAPVRQAPGPQPQAQPTPARPVAAQPQAASPPPPPAAPAPSQSQDQQAPGLGIINDATSFVLAQWAARPAVIIGGGVAVLVVLASLIGLLIHRVRRVRVFAWIEMPDARHTRVPVTTPGVRLGRHSDNDIRFDDKSVHRYHAVLSRDMSTGAYMISDVSRDNARSNGILINGELLHDKAILSNGDQIELGDVKFRFVYA